MEGMIRSAWNDLKLYIELFGVAASLIGGYVIGAFFLKKVKIPEIEKDIASIKKDVTKLESDLKSDINSNKTLATNLWDKEDRNSKLRSTYIKKHELYDEHGEQIYCTKKYCKDQKDYCKSMNAIGTENILKEIKALSNCIGQIKKTIETTEESRTDSFRLVLDFIQTVNAANPNINFVIPTKYYKG